MGKWDAKTGIEQDKADAMQRALKKKSIDLGSGFESLKKIFQPAAQGADGDMTDEEDKKKKYE